MGTVSNLFDATERSIGRNLLVVWLDSPADFTDPPETASDGANNGEGVAGGVSVALIASPRYMAGRKSAFLTLTRSAFLTATTYTVDLDGNVYTTTGEIDSPTAVAVLVSAINTAAVGNIRAAAVASTTDGVLDTVWAYETDSSSATADMVVDFTSDGVDDTVGYVDPESFAVRAWGKISTPSGLPVEVPWVQLRNGDFGAVPDQGLIERLNIAGLSRLYVQAYDVVQTTGDGAGVVARPYIAVAPAIAED